MSLRNSSKKVDLKSLQSCYHCGTFDEKLVLSKDDGPIICPGSNVDGCTHYILKSCNKKYHRCGKDIGLCRCSDCNSAILPNVLLKEYKS